MVCLQARYGWWRWVVTLAGFILTFLTLGLLFNYSILFVSLQAEFHSGSAITGWIGSISCSFATLFSPITVLLERKLSRRNIVLSGVVVYCAGLFVTSFVPALGYAYLTFGVLTGVGANLITYSSMSLLLDWFAKKNFSRASAFNYAGSTCGMLVFSPLLTACITHYGWRNALRILSGGILVIGIAAGLLLTNPPTEDYTTASEESPSDEKQELEAMVEMKDVRTKETDGENRATEDDKSDTKEVDNCDVPMHECQVTRRSLDMVKDIEAWLWSVGMMLSFLGWTFFNINFASFMEELDFNSNQIASSILLFACGELSGKILIAVIGDRLPFLFLYLLIASCGFGTVLLGCLTIAKTYSTVVLVAILSGFMRSGLYATTMSASAQLFHNTLGENAVLLLNFVPTGVGNLVSAPLSGGLYDVTGDYNLSILVIAAIFLCASAAFLAIPVRRRFRSPGSCCSPNTRPVQL